MPDTTLLGLPLLAAAQAQKHIPHNDALLRIDAAMQLSVISRTLASPPVAVDGDRYLVAAPGADQWAGQQGRIAAAQGGGWVFLSPRKGWRMWVEAESKFVLFDGAQWRDPLTVTELNNLTRLGVNAMADETNRLAVASAATLFSHAGSDHRLKINKNGGGDTASLIYQSGWSGRAEMGLAGSDDFRINVSADGTSWKPALAIDRVTGAVSLPNTPAAAAPPPQMIFSQSLAAQGPGFAVDTYLAGSAIAFPAGRLKVGSRYLLTFDVSKTAAGAAAPIFTLRFGAAGTLTDAALGAMTFPVQSAVSDDGRFTVDVTFRSVGAAAVVQAVAALVHGIPAGGIANNVAPVRRVTSGSFDSTLMNGQLGLSVNAGASSAWTVSLVQARLENIA